MKENWESSFGRTLPSFAPPQRSLWNSKFEETAIDLPIKFDIYSKSHYLCILKSNRILETIKTFGIFTENDSIKFRVSLYVFNGSIEPNFFYIISPNIFTSFSKD